MTSCVSKRETASEFQEEWAKMLVLFAAQTEIVKYLNRQIKPKICDWTHCFTRFNLNVGHRTTSPVESVNRMVKTYGISANSTLDETMKLYFDMVKAMKHGYEEAIFKKGSIVLRDLVKKPEFTLVKRKVAWKAMRLASLQLLKLERHRRGEAVELDKTLITQRMGIVSAKGLLERHGKARVVFQLEDFSPCWWLERSDDDTDIYLSLLDPDKVLILKGRPRNIGRFKSDSKDPQVHTQRLPPSTVPSALTVIHPSARRVVSAWETQDVADLTYSVAAAPDSLLPNSLSTSCGTKRAASSSLPSNILPPPPGKLARGEEREDPHNAS
ncbi:hypothetical protein PsorP6_011354 [Peronosclerospora sorghi]|uniref:Uncharacterized protein n=1 Tax=Peronosclerospora sorghi TaxID=230839 RepID=A0ACC0WJY4_9STRA|nr:hypothetical protein PsorP6_011354 [Peronosclerospora sorghi]